MKVKILILLILLIVLFCFLLAFFGFRLIFPKDAHVGENFSVEKVSNTYRTSFRRKHTRRLQIIVNNLRKNEIKKYYISYSDSRNDMAGIWPKPYIVFEF